MLLPKDNSFPDIFIYSENMDESGINFDNKSNNVNDVYSHINTKWNLEIEFSFPNYCPCSCLPAAVVSSTVFRRRSFVRARVVTRVRGGRESPLLLLCS
jgi:hypothetical protein